jgi:hypothetical protein
MQVKVHWIIDGIVELEADTQADAEAKISEMLQQIVSKNPEFTEHLGARAIQGKAYLGGEGEIPTTLVDDALK